MRYIKKPIKIDAWLIIQEELDSIWDKKKKQDPHISAFGGKLHGADVWFKRERKDRYDKRKGFGNVIAMIKTLEGDMIVRADDYLIKGIQKEYYPCKPDIFEKTYKQL